MIERKFAVCLLVNNVWRYKNIKNIRMDVLCDRITYTVISFDTGKNLFSDEKENFICHICTMNTWKRYFAFCIQYFTYMFHKNRRFIQLFLLKFLIINIMSTFFINFTIFNVQTNDLIFSTFVPLSDQVSF